MQAQEIPEIRIMFTFDKTDIEKAISDISNLLGVTLDEKLQQEYQNGQHPRLLNYEKIEKTDIQIPIIQKYLIGARTNLNQPCNYYDIFRLCRHVILIQILSQALTTTLDKVNNIQQRIERLTTASEYDDFEATLYEIVTASNYCLHQDVFNVEFIQSPQGRFDLIEHAHIIRGPGAILPRPMVSAVFTQPDEQTRNLAEFGIGHEIPDIDDVYKSDSQG